MSCGYFPVLGGQGLELAHRRAFEHQPREARDTPGGQVVDRRVRLRHRRFWREDRGGIVEFRVVGAADFRVELPSPADGSAKIASGGIFGLQPPRTRNGRQAR